MHKIIQHNTHTNTKRKLYFRVENILGENFAELFNFPRGFYSRSLAPANFLSMPKYILYFELKTLNVCEFFFT